MDEFGFGYGAMMNDSEMQKQEVCMISSIVEL